MSDSDLPFWQTKVENNVPFQWRGIAIVGVASKDGCTGCIAAPGRRPIAEPNTCHSLPICRHKVFMRVEDAVTLKLTGQFSTKDDHACS